MEGLPRLREGEFGESRGELQSGYGSKIYDGSHPKVFLGFDERKKREEKANCGILGESGTVWEMDATSLNGVFPDSEERHERTVRCAFCSPRFVGEKGQWCGLGRRIPIFFTRVVRVIRAKKASAD